MTDIELIEQMRKAIWMADFCIELDGFINDKSEYYKQIQALATESKRRANPELFNETVMKARK